MPQSISQGLSNLWSEVSLVHLSFLIAAMLILAGCIAHKMNRPKYQAWAAYYGHEASPELFRGYDVLVLEADKHPDLAQLKAQGSVVLAYFSLAEISAHRPYIGRFKDAGLVLGYNEKWHSYIIDIRRPIWRDFMMNEWLPAALAKGFDGIFIDTTDTALHWQQTHPQDEGMTAAAIHLIKDIRANMAPEKLIMVNRGFDILPSVASDINIILAESILVDAQTENRPYFPAPVYREYVDKLQGLKQKHSHLSIFTLDYPKTIDKTTWLQVCQIQQKFGFVPYISTMDLQQIKPPMMRCKTK